MRVSKRKVIYLLLVCFALVNACVEVFNVWNVISIFSGAGVASFFTFCVFQFAVSDALCIYERTFEVFLEMIDAILYEESSAVFIWIGLYLAIIYASFFLFMPFNYMNVAFQSSLFLYVYFPSLYNMVPFLINILVQPLVLTSTLNLFNKVCECLLSFRTCLKNVRVSDSSDLVYQFFMYSLNYLLCFALTLSFSESLYISMQYGVLHYKLMHASSYSLTRVQETMLLMVIFLSTLRTMFVVAQHCIDFLCMPRNKCNKILRDFTSLSGYQKSVYGWGYFTVLVRSLVRGLQSASFVSAFKQVSVNYIDKARRNATAYLILQNNRMDQLSNKWDENQSKKDHDYSSSYLLNLVRQPSRGR